MNLNGIHAICESCATRACMSVAVRRFMRVIQSCCAKLKRDSKFGGAGAASPASPIVPNAVSRASSGSAARSSCCTSGVPVR